MPRDIPIPAQLSIRFLTLKDRVRCRLLADREIDRSDAAVLTMLDAFGRELDEHAENVAIAVGRLNAGTPKTRFATVARMERRQERRAMADGPEAA